jgi:hypothetical protein
MLHPFRETHMVRLYGDFYKTFLFYTYRLNFATVNLLAKFLSDDQKYKVLVQTHHVRLSRKIGGPR